MKYTSTQTRTQTRTRTNTRTLVYTNIDQIQGSRATKDRELPNELCVMNIRGGIVMGTYQ